jgi:hypothetical protein
MSRRAQLAGIVTLLVGALAYLLVGVPLGIVPYRLESGLGFSPRLLPVVAAVALAAALCFGLVATLRAGGSGGAADEGGGADTGGTDTRRIVIAALLCLGFAFLVPVAGGFYLLGAALVAAIAWLLGERRPAWLVVYPVLLLASVYGIFEWGFQMRFPGV